MPLPVNKESDLLFLPLKQLLRARQWKKRVNPIYLHSCKFFGATLIDRTETLATGLSFHILDPLQPNLCSTSSLGFDELCLQRAVSIIETFPQRTLRVLWSGGIDSTVALVSLLRCLAKKDELSRLKVLLSAESVAEFSSFFHQVIQDKIEYRWINTTLYDAIDPDEVNITGEHGDQLFGSDKLKYAILTQEAFRPYDTVLPYLISRKLGTDRYTQAILKYMTPQWQQAPIKIKTLYDVMWWINFSMKWQTVTMRLAHALQDKPMTLGENLVHFFRSRKFEQWSITHHEHKIINTWQTYKYVAKEFIYRYYPDEHYRRQKEKEQSLKAVMVRH